MGLRAIAYKIQNAFVELVDNSNKEGKVIDYGPGNTLPNAMLKKIYDSGTATACIEKRITFINADGFNDPEFSKLVVNSKGQTADAILADLVPDVAIFEGGALLVHFSMNGEGMSVTHLPLECVRKKSGGGYVYNKNFGTREYKKGEDVHYPSYNPKTPASARVNKKFVLYFFNARPGKRVYPQPAYWSDEEDIRSDAGIQKTELSNIEDAFKADLVIKTIGEMDNKIKVDGKTEQDLFDDELETFQEPGGRRVLHLQASVPEGMAEIDVLDMSPAYDAIDKASDRVPRRLCRNMQVPPVIIGMDAASILGNQQALSNSVKMMNQNMLPLQALITEQFQILFPGKDCTITSVNIFEYIDSNLITSLTDEEKRSMLGKEPIEKSIPSDAEKISQALGSMSPLVANKVLDSMSKDEIRALVGLKAAETTTETTPPAV
jgi:hypothetical protein